MTELDERLRSGLRGAAGSVHPSPDLAARVEDRIGVHARRSRLARTALAGGLAAFIVAAGITAATIGSDDGDRPVEAASPRGGEPGWAPMAAAPIAPRFQHQQVWTGTEVLVFGGLGRDGDPVAGAAAYEPRAGAWRTIAQPPGAITLATWTGEQVLALDTSGGLTSYDPATDRWSDLAHSPYVGEVAFAGTISAAAWTGTELVIAYSADAADGRNPGDSSAYDPATDTWRTLPGAPFDIIFADAAWTGRELLVVGDAGASGRAFPHLELWSLDPVAGRWTELPTPPLLDPSRRSHGFAVWTGSELVVGGGHGHTGAEARGLADAAAYDPALGSWRALPAAPVPVDGLERTAEVWTGAEVLVWSAGSDGAGAEGRPVLFDPVSGAWRVGDPAPQGAHQDAPATWTGSELILWSGEVRATDDDPSGCCVPSAIGSSFTP